MNLFSDMLVSLFRKNGIPAEILSPKSFFYDRTPFVKLKKWAGYIDQYVMFPRFVRKFLKNSSRDTFFVFSDQALGPWVPLVKDRPHVIHTHDLLAFKSALGEVVWNPTSFTGRVYQHYIKKGFSSGRRFICDSKRTRDDLVKYTRINESQCDVQYVGFNYPYAPMPVMDVEKVLKELDRKLFYGKYWVHVGGNVWYKNTEGVIAIYHEYVQRSVLPAKLLIVTSDLTEKAARLIDDYDLKQHVIQVSNVSHNQLQAIYSGALGLIFPSHAEGFGWPIVEAMACGCPVITTNDPPMNEIGGTLACYVPKIISSDELETWAKIGCEHMINLERMDQSVRHDTAAKLVEWTGQFDQYRVFEKYLAVYIDEMNKWVATRS